MSDDKTLNGVSYDLLNQTLLKNFDSCLRVRILVNFRTERQLMNGTYYNLTIVMISSFYVDHMAKLEARRLPECTTSE